MTFPAKRVKEVSDYSVQLLQKVKKERPVVPQGR